MKLFGHAYATQEQNFPVARNASKKDVNQAKQVRKTYKHTHRMTTVCLRAPLTEA